MRKEIVDSNLLTHLSRFYPATCTIRTYAAENPDTYGQPAPVWANFAGHIDIPCAIASAGGDEVKMADMTIAIATHKMALAGLYMTIIPKMKVVVSGQEFDILLVEWDSHLEMTRLTTRIVG